MLMGEELLSNGVVNDVAVVPILFGRVLFEISRLGLTHFFHFLVERFLKLKKKFQNFFFRMFIMFLKLPKRLKKVGYIESKANMTNRNQTKGQLSTNRVTIWPFLIF